MSDRLSALRPQSYSGHNDATCPNKLLLESATEAA